MPSHVLSPTPESTPNTSVPNDLLLSCFARVSRLHYPTLSLVSKSFQSLLASPELDQIRSLLNLSESCLYVCLQFPLDPNPRWFTLCRKPGQTLASKKKKKKKNKKKKISRYVLARIPIPRSSPMNSSPRTYKSVVINTLASLFEKINRFFYKRNKSFQLYYCAIENIMYFYLSGVIKWYDTKVSLWREVKGLEALFGFGCCARLVDYGGKMAVLWDKDSRYNKKKVIWCAVIAFEKRNNNEEIWGKVEWFDVVLTVPESYEFVRVFSATV